MLAGATVSSATTTAATSTTKDVTKTKDITKSRENIPDIAKSSLKAATTQAIVAILVVDGPLLAISQHFVRFTSFFELGFSLGATLIAIGMKFQGGLSIGPLELLLVRITVYTEYLVVVPRQSLTPFLGRAARIRPPTWLKCSV